MQWSQWNKGTLVNLIKYIKLSLPSSKHAKNVQGRVLKNSISLAAKKACITFTNRCPRPQAETEASNKSNKIETVKIARRSSEATGPRLLNRSLQVQNVGEALREQVAEQDTEQRVEQDAEQDAEREGRRRSWWRPLRRRRITKPR